MFPLKIFDNINKYSFYSYFMDKLLVFDLNDTLLNSRHTYNKILIELISEKYNLPISRSRSIYKKSEKEALKKQKYLSLCRKTLSWLRVSFRCMMTALVSAKSVKKQVSPGPVWLIFCIIRFMLGSFDL